MASGSATSGEDGRPSLFLLANTLETGGGERQFATLAKSLNPEHLRLRLGCLRKRGPFAEGIEGLTEFPPQGSLFRLKSHRARLALARYLRANHVVIAHSFDFYSNLMLIPAARLGRIPIVVGSQRQLGDLMSGFRNMAQHTLFRFCDRILCNSTAAARGLEKVGIRRQKLAVIPNAMPQAAFAATAPALAVVPGLVRVVMVARMNDPAKRHDVFLKAAARIAKRNPDVEFVLVGDGPLKAGLEQLARELGLGNKAMFLGDRRDIPAVLASCQISVLSSDSESLSNAIMESMAAGLPVVACRVGGNEELVRDGETGFLVPAGDDEALADRIGRILLDESLRKKLGEAARADAQRFTVQKICAQYESFYMSLLEEKGIMQPELIHSR